MHKSQVYLWNAYSHISNTKMIEHFYLPKKFPYNYIVLICISQIMTNIKHLVIIAEQFAFTLNCWFISFVPFPSCVIIFASQILGDLYYLGFLLLYFSQCFIIFCFCLWHFLFMKLFFLLHSKLICIFCHWVGFSVVIFPLLSFSFFIIFHLNIFDQFAFLDVLVILYIYTRMLNWHIEGTNIFCIFHENSIFHSRAKKTLLHPWVL